jgi:polysaccharide deacetylase 2 family uncharacterized protein YibQ
MSVERIDKEQVNNIARHFLDAEDNARALPYLFQAAERAARAYSTPEAIGLHARGRDCRNEPGYGIGARCL